ncbi:membrane protein [Bacteroidia bacterium]|nr:membrane protein [Bacteroidia bacterium]
MIKIKDYPRLNYKLLNNVIAWCAFLVAAITYLLTCEPTASLWDCGEFIATSVGLQVGHPPGAPLFMILSRLFAIFAPSTEHLALAVNCLSALASAFTILFLFWTISYLARKLLLKGSEECALGQFLAIMGAALIGSLTYTFSDTFWFSAVEGEVYALSSLFTAVVFWAILKWEEAADKPYANRWLVLIAYLMGLSIGVHLLNLLAIPAIVFVYYFKKFKPSRIGFIKTSLVTLVILGFVNFMMIPGIIKVAGWFELLFVNSFGAPFNTGVIVYVLALIGGLSYGIIYTMKHHKTVLNTVLTCFVVILIGYSSYSMVVIRSISNPPIDENSPDNVFSLLSYINREQYGDSPLLYGQYYNAPHVDTEETGAIYYQNKRTGKYDVVGHKFNYKYDKRFCTFFPRMHGSSRPYFEQEYERWGGKPSGPIHNVNGKNVQSPSFGNNLKFFFSYQLGHMYWRYFLWNFSGRQNDSQGYGDIRSGNWLTGIQFVDEMRLGNLAEATDAMKAERGLNKYYMLPFILGLFGLFFQYRRGKEGKQDFFVVMLLFIMTGIAIIVFLNQTPREPRERDYAYAGSFYTYAIWIGLGVLGLYEWLKDKLTAVGSAVAVTLVCLLVVPVNMAAENWDDHTRAGRYATLAHAKNYLNTCDPNAILFTYGDNDTFPLWYAQEVEGVRRDIRIVNLSLLAGAWYIDQANRKAYESDKVKISVTEAQYHEGVRDYIPIVERFPSAKLKDALDFVGSDKPNTLYKFQGQGEGMNYMPTKNVYIPVDKKLVLANGTVDPKYRNRIVDTIVIPLKGNYLNKSQWMTLDIISTNNWERPVYFGIGLGTDSYMGFENYFQLEGAAYKLVPIKTASSYGDYGFTPDSILYQKIKGFDWGNIKDPKVNMDNFHKMTIQVMRYRNTLLRLSNALREEGKNDKAVEILDLSLTELPINQVPLDLSLLNYVPAYYDLGELEKGNQLVRDFVTFHTQELKYFNSLSNIDRQNGDILQGEKESKSVLQNLIYYTREFKQEELSEEISRQYEAIYNPGILTVAPQEVSTPPASAE